MTALDISGRDILARLDLAAEAVALGLRFAGNANGDGWRQCHAIDRDDRTPSATFNAATGHYRDHGGDGVGLSFFDLAAALDPAGFPDWRAAKDHFRSLAFPEATNGRAANGRPAAPHKPASDRPKGKTFPTAEAAQRAYEAKHGPVDRCWEYHDADGELVGLVLRWDTPQGKEIRPAAKIDDGWRLTYPADPRPLYGLPDFLGSTGRVFVAEGEKASDALRSIGLTATTSPGGSKAAAKADWSPLAGRDVTILPDNDPAGRQYAETVAAILAALDPPTTVTVLDLPDLPDLPETGDADDWLNGTDADGNWRHGLGDAAEPDDLRERIEGLADAAPQWEPPAVDPADRPDADLAWGPFPTDTFPHPLVGYVRASAAAIGCDESFVALPLLAAVAGAVGNARRVGIKRGWSEPAVVWAATIGESGSAKSPAFEKGTKPVSDRQKDARREHARAVAQWKSDHDAWQEAGGDGPEPDEPPPCPALWIDDATIEAVGAILAENERGTLVTAEELAGWLGSFDAYRSGKGNDAAKWLRMFGGREVRIDRRTGTPKTLYLPFASVSVAGTIQPGILRKHLTAENRESGMASRLLFAWPSRRPIRFTEAEVSDDVTDAIADLFGRLYSLDLWTDSKGERKPGLVPLSHGAKDLFREFMNAHGQEHAEQTGDLAAAFSKLIGYAARFALLFALVRHATGENDGPTEEVDATSMADAIRLARWFTGEAKRVYRLIDAGDAERERIDLTDWIRRKGGSVTPRDLQRGNARYKEPGKAEAALRDLAARGLVRSEVTQPGPAGGRPAETFSLTG
ncbi:MAG: DUF3987 domain-containing protein [Planctomycetaceae bacterium]